MKNSLNITLSVIAAIVVLIGCFRLPIGYYTFLRIVVFGVAIVNVYHAWKRDSVPCMVANCIVSVWFNPIIPIYLHNKTAWIVIDLIVAAWFVIQAVLIHESIQEKE